MERRRMTYR